MASPYGALLNSETAGPQEWDWTVDPNNTKGGYLLNMQAADPERFEKEMMPKIGEDQRQNLEDQWNSMNTPHRGVLRISDEETQQMGRIASGVSPYHEIRNYAQKLLGHSLDERLQDAEPQEITIQQPGVAPAPKKYHIEMKRSQNQQSPTGYSWAIHQVFDE
jgi:hypothetical protein